MNCPVKVLNFFKKMKAGVVLIEDIPEVSKGIFLCYWISSRQEAMAIGFQESREDLKTVLFHATT